MNLEGPLTRPGVCWHLDPWTSSIHNWNNYPPSPPHPLACGICYNSVDGLELAPQHSEDKDHGIWSHHFMGNRWGNSGNSVRLYF